MDQDTFASRRATPSVARAGCARDRPPVARERSVAPLAGWRCVSQPQPWWRVPRCESSGPRAHALRAPTCRDTAHVVARWRAPPPPAFLRSPLDRSPPRRPGLTRLTARSLRDYFPHTAAVASARTAGAATRARTQAHGDHGREHGRSSGDLNAVGDRRSGPLPKRARTSLRGDDPCAPLGDILSCTSSEPRSRSSCRHSGLSSRFEASTCMHPSVLRARTCAASPPPRKQFGVCVDEASAPQERSRSPPPSVSHTVPWERASA